jgi:PTS system nitrogen regulatory IIA component
MELRDVLNEQTIFFSEQKTKNAVLNELIQKAWISGSIPDKAVFKKAIEEREMLVSTGIGLGVAIPHAKLAGIKRFFVITGILKQPVEWDAIDNKPVQVVFLIGGPAQEQTTYLKLLAQIIIKVKDEQKRKTLFTASTPSDVITSLA